jgi:maltooligosyltrehalose trehalohydrolase
MTGPFRFGPLVTPDGVTFRLWAPDAKRVALVCDGASERMNQTDGGWFSLPMPGARLRTLYKFRIDDDIEVPDPASRYQPDDVNGPSEVIDPSYDWQARDWRGRPWQDCIFLELHVGTFTLQRNFRGVIDKLDAVVDSARSS